MLEVDDSLNNTRTKENCLHVNVEYEQIRELKEKKTCTIYLCLSETRLHQ